VFGTSQYDKSGKPITSTKKDITIPELTIGDVVGSPASGFSFLRKEEEILEVLELGLIMGQRV